MQSKPFFFPYSPFQLAFFPETILLKYIIQKNKHCPDWPILYTDTLYQSIIQSWHWSGFGTVKEQFICTAAVQKHNLGIWVYDRCLFCKHWSYSGIIYFKDLFGKDKLKPQDKRNWIIRNAIPQKWLLYFWMTALHPKMVTLTIQTRLWQDKVARQCATC